jgi:hypothetical protein
MKFLKYLSVGVLAAALVACGGGGGSAGTPFSGTTTPGSGTTTPGTVTPVITPPTVTVPTLTLAILNGSGAAVGGISLSGGFSARATVKDAAGLPVASKLVTFKLSASSIALLSPDTALTNSQGIAEVAIAPASVSSTGAATLSANADVSGTAVAGQVDFSIQSSSLTLSAMSVGSSNLQSGGNVPVQVTALIAGAAATGVPVNVSFSASCGRINSQATSAGGVSVTTNGNGVAAAVYDAVAADGSLCSGSVTLTASSTGATAQSTTINVAAPSASAVVFLSAAPAQIFLAGSGAADQAIVKFKVLSSVGTPLVGVSVNFSILTNPGGVGLNSAGFTGPVTFTSDSNGEASVSIFSGTIPGPVKVRAELAATPSVFAVSQNLTVASGPPSQRFMSLSVETFNIEGWEIDGTSTQLTVRVADRQGNAVDDGTVINFTAEGGQVARSCATARIAGISQCSVNFVAQNPRPAGGRASVLAYTEGTKDYVDVNGNNKFDAADTLINIGDAYRDDNENGSYNSIAGEFLIPRGVANGTPACGDSGGPFPSRLNTCDSSLQTTVRQQAVVLFSSSTLVPLNALNATTRALTSLVISTQNISFLLRSASNRLLPLPAGTTISATATDSVTTDGATCAVDQVFGSPVVNVKPGTDPAADIATSGAVTLKDCRAGDSVTIKVKVPSGLETAFFIAL